jgi:hypothetical protein
MADSSNNTHAAAAQCRIAAHVMVPNYQWQVAMRRPVHPSVTCRRVHWKRMASIRQWFRHQRLQLGEWLYWRRQADARARKPGLPSPSAHTRSKAI